MNTRRQSARELPGHGGRVSAWWVPGSAALAATSGAEVHYEVELCTASGRWTLDAKISQGGELQFSASEAPAWLRDYLRASMRGLWRQHRDDGRWPRRITRWRDEPEVAT